MRAVGAFDTAVELGAAWWQQEEQEAEAPARLFELGHELRSTIDLNCPDGKRGTRDEVVEGTAGEEGGGIRGNGRDGPAADNIDGGERTTTPVGMIADGAR